MEKKLTERAQWSERALEKYLKDEVSKLGGECLKYSNMAATGYPDRICLFPRGRQVWIELKSAGKKPTSLQYLRMRRLRELGYRAEWVDSREKIDAILDSYR